MSRDHWYPKGTLEAPYAPLEMTDVDIAFGAASRIETLLPPADEIPDEFVHGHGDSKWTLFFGDLFYVGVKDIQLVPKEGIDPETAWRHLSALRGSYGPKHEYKEAAHAFLSSLWFEDVTYEKAKR